MKRMGPNIPTNLITRFNNSLKSEPFLGSRKLCYVVDETLPDELVVKMDAEIENKKSRPRIKIHYNSQTSSREIKRIPAHLHGSSSSTIHSGSSLSIVDSMGRIVTLNESGKILSIEKSDVILSVDQVSITSEDTLNGAIIEEKSKNNKPGSRFYK